ASWANAPIWRSAVVRFAARGGHHVGNRRDRALVSGGGGGRVRGRLHAGGATALGRISRDREMPSGVARPHRRRQSGSRGGEGVSPGRRDTEPRRAQRLRQGSTVPALPQKSPEMA